MFKKLTLSKRLILGFGVMVAVTLAIALVGGWMMARLASSVDEVASKRLTSVSKLQEVRNNLNAQGHQVRNILISSDRPFQDAERKKALERVDWNIQLVRGLLATEADAKARDFLNQVLTLSPPFAKALEATVALAYADRLADARESLIGEMRERQMPLFKAVDDAIAHQMAMSQDLAQASTVLARSTAWAMLAAALGALLAAVVTHILIARSLMSSLGAEPKVLSQAAQQVASGDLSQAIASQVPNPGSVLAALVDMQRSLRVVVGQVLASSESVARGSSDIANGSHDLSLRTEMQAGALQQTTDTMGRLSVTVHRNTERAQQANQQAQEASVVAAQGGEVVGRVISTMQGIQDSSRKVEDIIGVIDGIAFQTNILALNAAVEAARAGEQGRGFAVVASEVRTLAQRSAAAAKEIKTLIGHSVQHVEQGTLLVDQAGKTMGEIVGAIERVSGIVAEISSASVEQTAGIAQVSDAVGQMDRATQQNAALVQQSASAADNLRAQANNLVQTVAVFRLSPGDVAAGAPGRHALQAANRTPARPAGAALAGPASANQ